MSFSLRGCEASIPLYRVRRNIHELNGVFEKANDEKPTNLFCLPFPFKAYTMKMHKFMEAL